MTPIVHEEGVIIEAQCVQRQLAVRQRQLVRHLLLGNELQFGRA